MASSVLPSGLAEAFGLSPVEIRMRSGRMMSVHYDVVDATGQEWFLKCSPTDHRIEHLDLLRAVHGRLNACRISVPIMRPTCDGRSGWVEGGRLYACYSLMPSERDALPREDGEAAGALLGRIHRALHGAAFTGAVWARSLANRSAAVRIPFCPSASTTRIEFRSPDPAANPYLALAAQLMAGLDGIRRRIDPTAAGFGPVDVDIYHHPEAALLQFRQVPSSLRQAVEALRADHDFLLEGGVFSEDLIETFIALKEEEIRRLETHPHPVEFEMYYDN